MQQWPVRFAYKNDSIESFKLQNYDDISVYDFMYIDI